MASHRGDAGSTAETLSSSAGVSATGNSSGSGGTAGPVNAGSATGAVEGAGQAPTGGGGGSAPAVDAAALPCAAASEEVGVSDTEITVGTVVTLSGPVPGLGASSLASMQAYVSYRNANGGVCGRQVVLRSGDDGLDNGRNRAIVSDMSQSILALVAGVAGGADGAVDVIDAEGLPVVGTSVTPGLERSPHYFSLNPPLASYDVPVGKYRFLHDQGVRAAAVVYLSGGSAPQQAQREMSLMRAAGIEVVNEQALPLSTLSYDSSARAVVNSGADYLLFLSADTASASMARSLDDTGYEGLRFEEYIIAYGSAFPELAGASAEGASTWLYALPAEDGGAVAEQAAFLEWMAQTAPDAALDTFAAYGWSSAKLLFDSLEDLPGPITREALLAQLGATGVYDAGGLLGPVDVAGRQSQGCVVGVRFEGGAWRRLTPATGFLC